MTNIIAAVVLSVGIIIGAATLGYFSDFNSCARAMEDRNVVVQVCAPSWPH